jgi:hypothetical protein
MIIGARTAEQLLLADAFQALGVPLWLMTEDGSAGRQGRVTDAAAILLATEKVGALYACGPTGMLAALRGGSRAGATGLGGPHAVWTGLVRQLRSGPGLADLSGRPGLFFSSGSHVGPARGRCG